ncbi:hypothetical protein JCM10914_1748 [Paenibacillus sp. JCM 10914]|nr:hypothetical protein JCM10914_1748 [Paenibacillus sp. JCM 10914]
MAIKMRLIRRFKESLLHKPVVLELSTLQEIELDVRTEIPCCRGFYINVGSKRIGIVATDEGPVLLCNQDKFLLKKDAFRFILQQNEEINTFTFMWKDGVKIQIPYVRSLIRSNGQWIDDYIFDFFAWLYEAAESHRFFAYYTVPGISITELFPDQTIHRVENKLLFA